MEVVVDRGQVVIDMRRILARFIYLFGVADPREVPLDVVKHRMTIETSCEDVPCSKFRFFDWRIRYHSNLAGNPGQSKRLILAWKIVYQRMKKMKQLEAATAF